MAKVVAAMNMTLDGYCDHTLIHADEELHTYYRDLLQTGGAILYGRKTYELMTFWKTLVETPSGQAAMDTFAVAMDRIPKIVFSTTLKDTGWDTAELAREPLEDVVRGLKAQAGRPIFVGSPGLIVALTNAKLIDEYQICVQPTVGASGLRLFDNLTGMTDLTLDKTHRFGSGSLVLYLSRPRERTA